MQRKKNLLKGQKGFYRLVAIHAIKYAKIAFEMD